MRVANGPARVDTALVIYIEFPKIGGSQYRPRNATILFTGTTKKVPLILGNPHVGMVMNWKL